jgi:hypothetical protein
MMRHDEKQGENSKRSMDSKVFRRIQAGDNQPVGVAKQNLALPGMKMRPGTK